MAKKILSTLLLCTFCVSFTSVFASNESTTNGKPSSKTTECNAPAPDSFRVTNIGSDLVTLGWTPAWTGATQTLELSIEDSGNWVVLFTNNEVPGDSYTLNELEPGYYKARIATNCVGGGTGIEYIDVPIRFKIIDLTTAGRTPLNPVNVNCEFIDYTNHEWVGFRVKEINTGIANFFEFVITDGEYPEVRRVTTNHPIVAVNKEGEFPIHPGQIVEANFPFRLDDLKDGQPENLVNIGYFICQMNGENHIKLCHDDESLEIPWKPEYEFTALVAESILVEDPDPSTDKSYEDTALFNEIKVQNPFNLNLNLFFPSFITGHNKVQLELINTSGQVKLKFSLNSAGTNVSIPTESILPGIYFLQVSTGNKNQILKIIKT